MLLTPSAINTLSFFVIISVWTMPALADVLTMKNGERFVGELLECKEDNVVWNSLSVGEIFLPKDRVDYFQSESQGEPSAPCRTAVAINSDRVQEEVVVEAERIDVEFEDPLLDVDKVSHTRRGKVNVTGRSSSGNSNESYWDIFSDIEYRRGDFRHSAYVRYEGTKKDNETAQDNLNLTYRLDIFLNEKWFYQSELSYGWDEPKSIEERYRLGQGVGYQFWDGEDSALALGGGLVFLEEDLAAEAEQDEHSRGGNTWRITADYRHKLPVFGQVFHKSEWLWGQQVAGDWRLNSETGITIPLGYGLHSEILIEYDYSNLPTIGNHKKDINKKIAIGYQW